MKRSLFKKRYKKYLESEEWAYIRNDIIYTYDSICQVCLKRTKHPQIHHLTYNNVFHERPSDLTLLCKACHKKVHGINFLKFNKKNFEKLRAQNSRLRSAIEDAIKIEAIWAPNEDIKKEHECEAIALLSMSKRFKAALKH